MELLQMFVEVVKRASDAKQSEEVGQIFVSDILNEIKLCIWNIIFITLINVEEGAT
jgi:hypothetical protein